MALASRGLRDMGDGPERLDAQESLRVKEQARRVHLRAFGATVAYAVLVLLLP